MCMPTRGSRIDLRVTTSVEGNFLGDPLDGSGEGSDRRRIQELEAELKDVKQELRAKVFEIRDLQMEMKKMTTRANDAENEVLKLRKGPVPKVYSGSTHPMGSALSFLLSS